MRIGVFSDTHDHLVAIDKALRAFRDERVEAVLHAGDFCSPFALRLILAHVGVPFHAVFGNNDGERRGLAKLLPDLSDGPRHFELGGRKFCLLHDPAGLRHEDEMASDVIVTGHLHQAPKAEMSEGRLYLDPGECCGWLTGVGRASILDTETLSVKSLVLLEQERPRP